jgi:hypothetical protein
MNEILDSDKELSYHYSNKSYQNFKQALFIYLFFIFGILIQVIANFQSDIITLVFGLPLLAAIPISFMGFIRGIKSITNQEPNNRKMRIGLIGNLAILALLLYLVITNIIDLAQ